MHDYLASEKGIAALAVTLILTLIATIFVLSTNKNSYLFQKTSVNHYQQTQAFEAAEAGAQATLLQMRKDIEAINSNSNYDGLILKKSTSTIAAPNAKNCGWDDISNNGDSYEHSEQFKRNNQVFSNKTTSLFQKLDAQSINTDSTAWRSTVDLANGIVSSEGCVDVKSTKGPFCADIADDQTAAVVRRGFDLPRTAIFNPKKIALTVKGHIDMSGSMSLDPNSGQPKPACNVSTGGDFAYWGAPLTPDSTNNTPLAKLSHLQLFNALFGMSPADFKAQASQYNPPLGSDTVTECPKAAGLIWINGNFTPPSNCEIGSSYPHFAPAIVVVGGSAANALTANGPGGNTVSDSTLINGMLFTNHLYGSLQILGAMAVNGDIEGVKNGVFDSRSGDCLYGACAHNPGSGSLGSINVAYDERMFIGANSGGNLSGNKLGSWHDFCGEGKC
ncbi:pilus assembly PilX N-terminal domain-containing protein [Iodobacter sp.]|uniref:pilus assembly PilX family protein n=1 Tax=Iodobacter sp. TaxID=1915058 RepID=UPI0025DBAA8F|nr:pilus assembly PilX N-terminal domain-containing protein [Iodobacter sp.]